jgi:hypothetical protein
MRSENWKTTEYNSWLPPPHLKKLNNSREGNRTVAHLASTWESTCSTRTFMGEGAWSYIRSGKEVRAWFRCPYLRLGPTFSGNSICTDNLFRMSTSSGPQQLWDVRIH